MDQLVGFLIHPPLTEIGKKIGKMLKYTPTFKGLSAPLIGAITSAPCFMTTSGKSLDLSLWNSLMISIFILQYKTLGNAITDTTG